MAGISNHMDVLQHLFIVLSVLVVASTTAVAGELPDDTPGDFLFSYEVASSPRAGVPGFRFTLSATGKVYLKLEGGQGVQFDVDSASVKTLYDAVRQTDILSTQFQMDTKTDAVPREVRVVADGNDRTLRLDGTGAQRIVTLALEDAVLQILDDKRPGWRGKTD
jgi:hypothetical protein